MYFIINKWFYHFIIFCSSNCNTNIIPDFYNRDTVSIFSEVNILRKGLMLADIFHLWLRWPINSLTSLREGYSKTVTELIIYSTCAFTVSRVTVVNWQALQANMRAEWAFLLDKKLLAIMYALVNTSHSWVLNHVFNCPMFSIIFFDILHIHLRATICGYTEFQAEI